MFAPALNQVAELIEELRGGSGRSAAAAGPRLGAGGVAVSALRVLCIAGQSGRLLRLARRDQLRRDAQLDPQHAEPSPAADSSETRRADRVQADQRAAIRIGRPPTPVARGSAHGRAAPAPGCTGVSARLKASLTVCGSQRAWSAVRNQPLKSMHHTSFGAGRRRPSASRDSGTRGGAACAAGSAPGAAATRRWYSRPARPAPPRAARAWPAASYSPRAGMSRWQAPRGSRPPATGRSATAPDAAPLADGPDLRVPASV